MASIFSKLINGELPSYKVYEDDKAFAFLDINPIAEGHLLVVPKKEVDYIFDLDPETLSHLHLTAQKIAKAMDQVFDCERVGVAVVGLEVPHAHIHLIPINGVHDIDFSRPKIDFSEQEFKAIQQKITDAI
ncbi:HIT family protein [Salibacter sp.]|uniref:HIT family protein n=1 Tax=Salibacter sp. TaxID=2010995 RepID=UPI00286FDB95|nr:HIT family protein [Salibacter sp.]MDR9397829.1 HIT family protein [Salibacter sp.]MDR9487088.1 HIT family protein [Salibacter sp.]